MSDENMVCISKVATIGKERSGGFPGFDSVLMYLDRDLLVELFPEYPGSIFQDIIPLLKDFFNYIKSNNLAIHFIEKMLRLAIKENIHPQAGMLAEKILIQMESDEKKHALIRRPTYYVCAGEEGFAVAICIDDRFWTDKW